MPKVLLHEKNGHTQATLGHESYPWRGDNDNNIEEKSRTIHRQIHIYIYNNTTIYFKFKKPLTNGKFKISPLASKNLQLGPSTDVRHFKQTKHRK